MYPLIRVPEFVSDEVVAQPENKRRRLGHIITINRGRFIMGRGKALEGLLIEDARFEAGPAAADGQACFLRRQHDRRFQSS